MSRLVLAGGDVVDGTGAPACRADVLVEDATIKAVGAAIEYPRDADVRDVAGLTICPGFIDAHSHADNAPLLREHDESKILQGVTTEVVGNCGLSLAPRSKRHGELLDKYLNRLFPPTAWAGESVSDFLRETDRHGYVTNYVPLVGHGSLRIAVMGFDARKPEASELDDMMGLLAESLRGGAAGLSTGLVYPPGQFADTPELVALAGVVRDYGGIYASHVRSEGHQRVQAIEEAIAIGRDTGVRVQISHHKAMGRRHWGEVAETVAIAETARQAGVDVRFDLYPYTASSTMLTACLPPRLASLSDTDLIERLADPATVRELELDLARDDWDNKVTSAGGYSGILIASTHDGQFEGRTLQQIADDAGVTGVEALIAVLREEKLRASMVCFAMDEVDIEAGLGDRLSCIGSDGLPPGVAGKPHPRQWGTFPRILGEYTRHRRILTLQEAVHRMTGLPADTFGLQRVGRLAAGYAADLVILDPHRVRDRATYEAPTRPPEGIHSVFVGGTLVVDEGRFLGLRAGRRIDPKVST